MCPLTAFDGSLCLRWENLQLCSLTFCICPQPVTSLWILWSRWTNFWPHNTSNNHNTIMPLLISQCSSFTVIHKQGWPLWTWSSHQNFRLSHHETVDDKIELSEHKLCILWEYCLSSKLKGNFQKKTCIDATQYVLTNWLSVKSMLTVCFQLQLLVRPA